MEIIVNWIIGNWIIGKSIMYLLAVLYLWSHDAISMTNQTWQSIMRGHLSGEWREVKGKVTCMLFAFFHSDKTEKTHISYPSWL